MVPEVKMSLEQKKAEVASAVNRLREDLKILYLQRNTHIKNENIVVHYIFYDKKEYKKSAKRLVAKTLEILSDITDDPVSEEHITIETSFNNSLNVSSEKNSAGRFLHLIGSPFRWLLRFGK